MKENVLFVDDDPMLLAGLKRMLRPMQKEWEMTFVDSPREAIRQMERLCFDVVVVDMRMPEIDGAQLLEEVRRLCPKSVRIVLSGQADLETIFRAVGPAHQYLAKPCDTDTLKAIIRRAVELRDSIRSVALREGVSTLCSLPSSAAVLRRLSAALQAPEVSLEAITEVVVSDLGLSAAVLKAVHSAFFCDRRELVKPADACQILGVELLRGVLGGVEASQSEDSRFHGWLDRRSAQAVLAARSAEQIAANLSSDRTFQTAAYVATLFGRCGEHCLTTLFPEEQGRYVDSSFASLAEQLTWERSSWGSTHCQVGAYLFSLWGVSGRVVDGIRFSEMLGNGTDTSVSVELINGVMQRWWYHYPQFFADDVSELPTDTVSGLSEQLLKKWLALCSEQLKSSVESSKAL